MRLFFLIGASLLSVSALAQSDSLELDPVTVTSGIAETAASKSGRNILVIKGDRFQQLPVHSIDELLRYVPGIEVQARGAMGAQSDIVIRGGTFQQVLVLLDGVRLNDPITGHFNSYIPLSPAEIEHIEILKGAASVIYGSEAVGGVIHIITKSFAAKKGMVKKQLSAQVAAGSYDLLHAQVGGFFTDGRSAFSGGFLSNNSDGQPQRGINSYFNLHTASLSASHFVNEKLRVSYRAAYDDRKFSAQNYYTTFASDTATEKVKSSWNQLHVSYQSGRNHVTVDGGLKTADDTYSFNPKAISNLNKSKLWQAIVQNRHRISGGGSFVSGAQFYNRTIRSNDRGEHNESQVAAFALLQYEAPSGFSFSPALRLDWNEQRGVEIIPQAALSYRRKNIQLRGILGKTIRDADFTERYNNYNKVLVTSGRIGNPDLGAETSFNYEAGADYFILKGLKLSGTFFQRFHKDLIDYVPTAYADMPRKENLSPTGTYALAKNIAEVNILGAETDLQFIKQLNTNHAVTAGIGVVWLDVQNSEGASAFYISSFAKLLTNFNLSLSTPRFEISTTGLYKEREAQAAAGINAGLSSSYFVQNGKTEWKIVPGKFGVFVQVDNIFDKHYSDFLGATMPGRWFQGGARFTFNK